MCRSRLKSAPTSGFNTAVSFASNTSWQSYGGEIRPQVGQSGSLAIRIE